MKRWIMGVLGVLIKEFHEVRRQPRMLFMLIVGPLLVLGLFGTTFLTANPVLRAVLVWPEEGIPGVDREMVEGLIRNNFTLVATISDQEEAMQMLSDREVDVVQIVPESVEMMGGDRPKLQILSRTINPNVEPWLSWLTYLETSQINRQILLAQTVQAQEEASQALERIEAVEQSLNEYLEDSSAEREAEAENNDQSLQDAVEMLLALIPATSTAAEGTTQSPVIRDDLLDLLDELSQLDQDISSDPSLSREERVRLLLEDVQALRKRLEGYVNLSPTEIVAPIQPAYTNLRGDAYSMMIYYTPGVLALLLQHLAVTLGALGLVRERLRGAYEMYQVTPINAAQILLGKTLAYSLYVLAAGAALAFLLHWLGVPVRDYIPLMIALGILLSLASVGMGLLISAVSPSDSQAVQLTMIVLLLSFFFSGFFLPLTSFKPLAQPVSVLIPMTHGLSGFQALMLVGRLPGVQVWVSLVLIILVSFGLLSFLLRRKL